MPTSSCLIVCERSRRKGRRSRSNITGRVRDSRRHRWAYNIPIYFVKKYFFYWFLTRSDSVRCQRRWGSGCARRERSLRLFVCGPGNRERFFFFVFIFFSPAISVSPAPSAVLASSVFSPFFFFYLYVWPRLVFTNRHIDSACDDLGNSAFAPGRLSLSLAV